MKKILTCIALAFSFVVNAQTLNIVIDKVTYAFPASQAGDMVYTDGTSLTILNKTFDLTNLTKMYIDNSGVEDNTVAVEYDGDNAYVVVAGNIAQYITPIVDGAQVSIEQSEEVGETTCGEISYLLSGESSNGSFGMTGAYKSTIELHDLSLINPSGAPIDIQNGKRIDLSIKSGTTNSLVDGADGSQKGCIVCKGHLEFKGKGVLNVTGNKSHAIYAKEYIEMKNCSINVLGAVKDGLNCNQYLLMESGELNIGNVGDDGVQVSFKDDTDREAEDTGSITISGGTITVSATAKASKAIKADGNIVINGGNIKVVTTGMGGEGIESKNEMTINDGTILVNSYDDGLNSSSHMYVNGGDITVVASNNDGLDSNGHMYLNGGVVRAFGGAAPETGLDANDEEGYHVYITGGTILGVGGNSNSTPQSTTNRQYYLTVSGSPKAGDVITVQNGNTEFASFTVPDNYSSTSSGGGNRPGGGGGGMWGGSNGNILISCAGLTSGTSYTVSIGTTTSTVTAK